jgi:hypothetical protein
MQRPSWDISDYPVNCRCTQWNNVSNSLALWISRDGIICMYLAWSVNENQVLLTATRTSLSGDPSDVLVSIHIFDFVVQLFLSSGLRAVSLVDERSSVPLLYPRSQDALTYRSLHALHADPSCQQS